MKAIAESVAAATNKRVGDMNPITQILRKIDKAEASLTDQYRECAKLIAAQQKDGESGKAAHARLMGVTRAIVKADGVEVSKTVMDNLSRWVVVALAGDLQIEVRPATSKAAAVTSPAKAALDTMVGGKVLGFAAKQVRAAWDGKAAPQRGAQTTPKAAEPADIPITPAPTTDDGKVIPPSKTLLKNWLVHAASRRQLDAVLGELGFTLTAHKPAVVKHGKLDRTSAPVTK